MSVNKVILVGSSDLVGQASQISLTDQVKLVLLNPSHKELELTSSKL